MTVRTGTGSSTCHVERKHDGQLIPLVLWQKRGECRERKGEPQKNAALAPSARRPTFPTLALTLIHTLWRTRSSVDRFSRSKSASLSAHPLFRRREKVAELSHTSASRFSRRLMSADLDPMRVSWAQNSLKCIHGGTERAGIDFRSSGRHCQGPAKESSSRRELIRPVSSSIEVSAWARSVRGTARGRGSESRLMVT